jgi:glycosyltransferase involved in cell wall biosynthesis
VVTDGVTGLHVDPEDMEAIYQALVRLLRDKDLRERFGAAGRERADEVFSLASFANRAARLLRKRS